MKGQIINPCSQNWDHFKDHQDNSRFCSSCQTNVFDITQMNEQEILDLYNEHHQNICVRANQSQLKNRSVPKYIRKIGIACAIVLSSFFSEKAIAQVTNQEYLDSFKISQTIAKDDSITIKGIVKGEKKGLFWRRLKNAEIQIVTEDGLTVKNVKTTTGGQFTVRLPKKLLGERFSIVVSSNDKHHYLAITAKQLEVKDTDIKFFMKDAPVILIGRYLF